MGATFSTNHILWLVESGKARLRSIRRPTRPVIGAMSLLQQSTQEESHCSCHYINESSLFLIQSLNSTFHYRRHFIDK